ncbi:MAG: hypothetical protein D6736_08360, partial [Nitrospinota bacterium]
INLKERTPDGVVEPGAEYEEIRNRLIEKLHAAVDPETGERFIEKVLTKEEAFSGPFLHKAPDILIGTRNLDYLVSTNYYFGRSFRKKRIGNHKMEGILILHGPPFKKGYCLQGAHIQDCMPTIFYVLGLPIPSDFDGRILEEAFVEEYLKTHRPTWGDPVPFESELKNKELMDTYSSEEAEVIRNRLQSLGYIE